MKEADIRRKICEYLDRLPQCVFRINSENRKRTKSKYLPMGWSDISGSYGNRALYLEVKRPGGAISKPQMDFIIRARDLGCIAAIVESVEDAQAVIMEAERTTQ